MSATIELRDDQVEAVITEALAQDFFETGPDGSLPNDIDDRRKAAVELVRQATLSSAVGNDHPGVAALLRIAEVDSGPVTSTPPEGDIMAATDAEQLAAQPNEMLPKLLQTLSGFEQTDDVKANVALIQAEMERRGLPIPETSAPAAAPAAAEPAQAPPVAQETPQVSRQDLEDRLTFPMMRAHQIDPSEISSLTDSQLQWIIDHPAGGEAPTAAPAATQQEEPVDPGDVIQTTRMVTTPPEPAPAAPAPVAQPTIAEQNGGSAISSQREDLEAQITGPILKVYGRGHMDVPEIGDAELGFMIANPDGRVTQDALDAAKALDRGESVNAHDLDTDTDNDDGAQPTIAEQKREAKAEVPPAASQEVHSPASASAFAPAAEAAVEAAAAEAPPTTAPSSASPDPAPAVEPIAPPAASGGRVTRQSALNRELPENPAQSIIDKENFPIPPTLDEQTPRLPFDLSQCSDQEIASYHAKFHACSVRMNYVVGLWESELRDAIKLRKGREVEVANDLPAKDGRTKLTDAQREAMVQADGEVVRLRGEEHEIEKVLRQLRVLGDNYSRDVAVCSRQFSIRHREAEGARA